MTGLELRQKREDWGLTQVRFAALLFVGHTTILMWETGMRKISPRYQRAIIHFTLTPIITHGECHFQLKIFPCTQSHRS
ncbi:MAG: helix-turn-helix transcriptional regulator [Pseudomonadota bacterium]